MLVILIVIEFLVRGCSFWTCLFLWLLLYICTCTSEYIVKYWIC